MEERGRLCDKGPSAPSGHWEHEEAGGCVLVHGGSSSQLLCELGSRYLRPPSSQGALNSHIEHPSVDCLSLGHLSYAGQELGY